MKATDLLKAQHRDVEEVLGRFHKHLGAPEIEPLLHEIGALLGAHLLVEREIFYPACAETLNDREVMRLPYRRQVELVNNLRDLVNSNGDADTVRALAAEVVRAFREHLQEEGELYPKIEPILGDKGLEELCGEMDGRFDEGIAQGFQSLIAEGCVEEADLDRHIFERRERAMHRTVPMKDKDTKVRKDVPAAVRHAAAHVAEEEAPASELREKPEAVPVQQRVSEGGHRRRG
jgi:hypothetical protein